ncbi:MAG: hypothetical protein P4L33_06690 [Capsulimonadaceae bacterium]|nr:hypothetical protein [Capsulimonadaceae bacterium]
MSSPQKLVWTRKPDGTYSSTGHVGSYELRLQPAPIDRWVVRVNGKVELDDDGQPIHYWRLTDSKLHCQKHDLAAQAVTADAV